MTLHILAAGGLKSAASWGVDRVKRMSWDLCASSGQALFYEGKMLRTLQEGGNYAEALI
jgi:hypothetical protein